VRQPNRVDVWADGQRCADGPWAVHGVEVDWVRSLTSLGFEEMQSRLEKYVRQSIAHNVHPGIRIVGIDGRLSAGWPSPGISRERWPAWGRLDSNKAIEIMRECFVDGHGLQFRFADRAFSEIAAVRATLSRITHHSLKVTLFISACGAGVLDLHRDSNAAGIVHLFGRKFWKLGARSLVRNPFAEMNQLNDQALLTCEPKGVTLARGAVLFFPGGHPHVVKTTSEVAAHLTFSADVRSWAPTRLAVIAEIGRVCHELGRELPRGLTELFSQPRDLETDEGLIAFFKVLPEVDELMNGDPTFSGLERIWNIAKELYQPSWGRALWTECHGGELKSPPYPYQGPTAAIAVDDPFSGA
jgi:hypothetical protein